MKPLFLIALCAVLPAVSTPAVQINGSPAHHLPIREMEEPLPPVGELTVRESWRASKASLSPDARVYREAASRKLEELAKEVEELRNSAARQPHFATRPYFETRLRALREHLEYARAELTKLPADKAQPDYVAARAHFDHTLSNLETALDQCQEEVRDRT